MDRFLRKMKRTWAQPSHKIIWQYRMATWSNRQLPSFIIIGAQKAGTTSMFAYLSQHPQLVAATRKEVHFFDGGLDPRVDNFQKGKAWYYAHFPLKHKSISANQISFDASPLYIFNPLVPQRIASLIPNVKIIALLRNPTERAISHFFHAKKKGLEPLDLDEALLREEDRLEPVIAAKDYKNAHFIRHSYKSRGLYKEQLERYTKYFSREQILVMASEDFFTAPDTSLQQVFEFVGVDSGFKVSDLRARNVAKNKNGVASRIYDDLDNFYEPHNQALYDMLGQNYGW